MAIFKFRVAWQEDDNIQRDIVILSSQSYFQLHECIKKAFALKPEWQAVIGVMNENGRRVYSLDTKLEKNIRGADFLSASRTPIGALINHPSQEMVYALENDKEWDFTISFISVDKSDGDPSLYPAVVREEGISPMELSASKNTKASAMPETNDQYDLNTEEGFGTEGEAGGEDEGGSGFTIIE